MKEVRVDGLFPTPVLVSDNNQFDIPLDVIESFNFVRMSNGLADWSEDKQVLQHPRFCNIKETIDSHIELWFRDILRLPETVKPRMISSWLVRMRKGDRGIPHAHANCIAAGVAYLRIGNSTGDITFVRDLMTPLLPIGIDIDSTDYHLHNAKTWTYRPAEGTIIIFPGQFVHGISENINDDVRYSLAFNVWVQGKIGKNDSEMVI